jgi:acetolactate synthase-1/2/3 large subunit
MRDVLLDEEVGAGEAVVRALLDAGVDHVFGMPGGMTIPIFDALFDHTDAIRTVLVREETRAGVMAEVYGRLTGRPAVAMGQGAFLTTASVGAIEAHLSSSPMLLFGDLSDGGPYALHAPYQSGVGAYGSWDARAVFGGFSKRVFVATTPLEAVQAVQLAVKHAVTGEPGPVSVLFGARSVRGTVGPDSRPKVYRQGPAGVVATAGIDSDALAQAVDLLAGASRPVVIAGGGVRISRAFDDLHRVATTLGAPVATSANGKSAIAETDDLAVGVFGNFGTPLANAVVGAADVVLVVGSKLGPTDTALEHPGLLDPSRQRIVHIDVEPVNTSWSVPADVSVIGDAKAVLSRLAEDLAGRTAPSDRDRRLDAFAADVDEHGRFDQDELVSDATPILPQRVIGDLHRALPDDAVVCCDAGENRIFMTHYFRTRGAGTFVQPAGVGAMGYAIPGALAAVCADPSRPAVAVCGDGGFAIGMNGLMTAREERLPITVVVMNNQALGWVLHGQRDRQIASRFAATDHAAVARALGCEGVRVESPGDLVAALSAAVGKGVTTVIDVVTSLDETFEKVTSPLVR